MVEGGHHITQSVPTEVALQYEDGWRTGGGNKGFVAAMWERARDRGEMMECSVGLMRATYTPEQIAARDAALVEGEVEKGGGAPFGDGTASPASSSTSASSEFGDDDVGL